MKTKRKITALVILMCLPMVFGVTGVAFADEESPIWNHKQIIFDADADNRLFTPVTSGGHEVFEGKFMPQGEYASSTSVGRVATDSDVQITFVARVGGETRLGILTDTDTLSGYLFRTMDTSVWAVGTTDNIGSSWLGEAAKAVQDGAEHTFVITIESGVVTLFADRALVYSASLAPDADYVYLHIQQADINDYIKIINIGDIGAFTGDDETDPGEPGKDTVWGDGRIVFDSAEKAGLFVTVYGGFEVKNERLVPKVEWASATSMGMLVLDRDLEISFVTKISAETRLGILFDNELLTGYLLRTQSGSVWLVSGTNNIGDRWLTEAAVSVQDGEEHTVNIKVTEGIVTFAIDGKTLFTRSLRIGEQKCYLHIQYADAADSLSSINIQTILQISDDISYSKDEKTEDPTKGYVSPGDDGKWPVDMILAITLSIAALFIASIIVVVIIQIRKRSLKC